MHIKLTNGIPEKYTIGQLRRDNPQVSFPKIIPDDTLAEYDVYPLQATNQPEYDHATQKVAEGTAVEQGGLWVQVWNIVPMSPEEQQAYFESLAEAIVQQTQQRLDDFAKTRNYSGILSACTYATSGVAKFTIEGTYCVAARDATWAKLYQILAEVEDGLRPAPSGYTEIEPELPVLVWP
jgi:hypothetical protein